MTQNAADKVPDVLPKNNGPIKTEAPKVDVHKFQANAVGQPQGGQGGSGGANHRNRGGRGGGNRNNRGGGGGGFHRQNNHHQNQPRRDLMSVDLGQEGILGQGPNQVHGGQRPDGMRDGMRDGTRGRRGGGVDRGRDVNYRGGGGEQRGAEDRFAERMATISGPTIELPPIDTKEKQFNSRCRLYIGNLTNDVTKEELEELFKPFGECSECFVNAEKNFAFIRLDYRVNAEKARRELDGFTRKGRQLKVRWAPQSASIKVRNLNPYVTNELLEWAFQVFGEIERAVVIADERGKSTGEGIVEYARKPAALQAMKRCTEGNYFITGSLRPVIVEPYEPVDDMDGYSEKAVKKTAEFFKEREVGPRFGTAASFEADYGNRWKALSALYKQKEDALKREHKLEEDKLEAQMEYARYEHETEQLRQQLMEREQNKERQKRECELRERAVEEQKRNDDELLRRQADQAQSFIKQQEEDLIRRQQENSLFMRARQLDTMMLKEEQSVGNIYEHELRESPVGGAIQMQMDPKSLLDAFDGRGRNPRDERPNSRWSQQDRRGMPSGGDDYPNKRRRY